MKNIINITLLFVGLSVMGQESIPFVIIEDVPVFPGCVGNNEQLKKCFAEKVMKYVGENFNTNLASELGLPSGIQRIWVLFKIDRTGEITDIQVRSRHKRLTEEAIRVIKKLPRMAPGRQRGKPVGVKYSLPIVFKVEGDIDTDGDGVNDDVDDCPTKAGSKSNNGCP